MDNEPKLVGQPEINDTLAEERSLAEQAAAVEEQQRALEMSYIPDSLPTDVRIRLHGTVQKEIAILAKNLPDSLRNDFLNKPLDERLKLGRRVLSSLARAPKR